MKCNCGFENGKRWDDDKRTLVEINPDEPDFIMIKGQYYREEKDGYYRDTIEVGLYACPKCGAVIMEDL